MIETFTKNSTQTSNGIDMEQRGQTEILGADELSFYNSLGNELNSLKCDPKKETLQSILNYSKNLRSIK